MEAGSNGNGTGGGKLGGLLGSVSAQLSGVVFAATLTSSLLAAWISLSAIDDFLERQIREEFPTILATARERVSLWYSQVRLDLDTFSRSPTVVKTLSDPDQDPTKGSRYLHHVLERFPQYEALFLLDAEGRLVLHAGSDLPDGLASVGERVATAGPVVSTIPDPAGRVLQLASAPVQLEGRRIGSLNALLRGDAVAKLLASERLGRDGALFLVGDEGRLLTAAPGRPVGSPHAGVAAEPGTPVELVEYAGADGVAMIGAGVQFADVGGSLFVERPYADAFAPSVGLTRQLMLLDFATASLFGLIALALTASIMRPIRALLGAVRRVRDGETDVAIEGISRGGELGELIVAFNDMTSSLERAIQDLDAARAEAEAASVTKSEFLANMSHEIRTPIAAILGFNEVLHSEGDLERAPPGRVKAIETIWRNGEHLLALINDILDISKIEAGRLELERLSCSPIQMLAEVMDMMRGRAEDKDLELDCVFETLVPEAIRSDPTRLRQILINLVGNAIKFTEEGGVQLVVALEGEGETTRLRIDVIDTGIGIDPEHIERVFEAFSQADPSMTRRFGGTGLGLAISKRLAVALGGDLEARPCEGRGSRFTLRIAVGPLEGVKLVEAPELECVPTAPRVVQQVECPPCRVLVAEDGQDNQALLRFFLTKAGASVELVENGRLAVDAALRASESGEPYDVILMDMQMPELDGYEATRELRNRGYDGAIIALTAHAMSDDRQKCLAAGCDDFATKPVDRVHLIGRVAHFALRAIENRERERDA